RTMHTPQHPHSNTSTLDTDKGLGSSGFARHYYRNHCYFLFLRVLRCFTSPRSPHAPYTFRHGSPPLTVAGFPHSDILGSTPVYRLPEAYRRFPRPSSAPDAKASTMRSHTLTTPKGPASCAREMFQTHSYLMTRKITLHKQHSIVLLMLASTIRFSNHYQTPPTTKPLSMAARGTGRSRWLKPHPTLLGFVIPGPNNVSVPA